MAIWLAAAAGQPGLAESLSVMAVRK